MNVTPLPTKPVDLPLRRKILWIDSASLLHMFFLKSNSCQVVLPRIHLPEPLSVQHVQFSFERNAFGFMLCSPHFEPVPAGEVPPSVEAEFIAHRLLKDKPTTRVSHQQVLDAGLNVFALQLLTESIGRKFKVKPDDDNTLDFLFEHRGVNAHVEFKLKVLESPGTEVQPAEAKPAEETKAP